MKGVVTLREGLRNQFINLKCVDLKSSQISAVLGSITFPYWAFISGQILHIHLGLGFIWQGGITGNMNIDVTSKSGPEELDDDGITIDVVKGFDFAVVGQIIDAWGVGFGVGVVVIYQIARPLRCFTKLTTDTEVLGNWYRLVDTGD
jgi:hypothetical protein